MLRALVLEIFVGHDATRSGEWSARLDYLMVRRIRATTWFRLRLRHKQCLEYTLNVLADGNGLYRSDRRQLRLFGSFFHFSGGETKAKDCCLLRIALAERGLDPPGCSHVRFVRIPQELRWGPCDGFCMACMHINSAILLSQPTESFAVYVRRTAFSSSKHLVLGLIETADVIQ